MGPSMKHKIGECIKNGSGNPQRDSTLACPKDAEDRVSPAEAPHNPAYLSPTPLRDGDDIRELSGPPFE